MGLSRCVRLDMIVYVDPVAYYELAYADKPTIAKAIGDINWKYRGQGKHMMLMVPGRIGTSSPELGVPTSFSDISESSAIFEVAESRAGYNPELSYGSHIFQDLVENEILYMAVFEDERTRTFDMKPIIARENRIGLAGEDLEDLASIVGLYLMEPGQCQLYHDLYDEHLVCLLHQSGKGDDMV